MPSADTYLIATIRPWNVGLFQDAVAGLPGRWTIITRSEDLTADLVRRLQPRYIFFPHWSHLVPPEILDLAECVCFHESDVPFGRGGSPVQNLIARGHRETKVTALRMVPELDAGPVYLKEAVSLEGLAEEIFIRISKVVLGMVGRIVREEPRPIAQSGEAVVFKRRTPVESLISASTPNLSQLFDHLRMLDAAEYPRAFIEIGGFRYEFSRPALRSDSIEADVTITRIEKSNP